MRTAKQSVQQPPCMPERVSAGGWRVALCTCVWRRQDDTHVLKFCPAPAKKSKGTHQTARSIPTLLLRKKKPAAKMAQRSITSKTRQENGKNETSSGAEKASKAQLGTRIVEVSKQGENWRKEQKQQGSPDFFSRFRFFWGGGGFKSTVHSFFIPRTPLF